jgi:hypothetical protein
VADTGWQPMFLSVWEGDELRAACPAWLKTHSYGEYMHLCTLPFIDQMTLSVEDGSNKGTGESYAKHKVETCAQHKGAPGAPSACIARF